MNNPTLVTYYSPTWRRAHIKVSNRSVDVSSWITFIHWATVLTLDIVHFRRKPVQFCFKIQPKKPTTLYPHLTTDMWAVSIYPKLVKTFTNSKQKHDVWNVKSLNQSSSYESLSYQAAKIKPLLFYPQQIPASQKHSIRSVLMLIKMNITIVGIMMRKHLRRLRRKRGKWITTTHKPPVRISASAIGSCFWKTPSFCLPQSTSCS